MRARWSEGGERLSIARRGQEVLTELACSSDVLWSGNWSLEVRRNGELVRPDADAEWDEVCWASNEDGDYLEIEMALSETLSVQRQFFLARDDRFLFLADAILGEEAATLDYRSVLPLATDVNFDPSSETREGYPRGTQGPRDVLFRSRFPNGVLIRVVALWKRWRAGSSSAPHAPSASRLYFPMFIDLDPKRLYQPGTWRQLTVAELRQIVTADIAVGYRMQVRKQQWLVYRSLAKRGNRTLLGQNLVSEVLVSRFLPSGEYEPLVEIE